MSEFPIIKRLGGRKAVFEEIREPLGLTTLRSMGMWVSRRSMPGEAMVALMALADARGVSYGPEDFTVSDEIDGEEERAA